MPNMLHTVAFVQAAALGGCTDYGTMKRKLRAADLEKLFPHPQKRHAFVLQVFSAVKASANSAAETALLRLSCDENALRADVLDALDELPLTNAADVREACELRKQVAASEGAPSLAAALLMLQEHPLYKELCDRFELLWPAPVAAAEGRDPFISPDIIEAAADVQP